MRDENINYESPAEELNSVQLEQAVGGGSPDTGWLEDGIPSHWAVTCVNCGMQFFVRFNKDCPSCANTEVYLTYDQNKPVYDAEGHTWR